MDKCMDIMSMPVVLDIGLDTKVDIMSSKLLEHCDWTMSMDIDKMKTELDIAKKVSAYSDEEIVTRTTSIEDMLLNQSHSLTLRDAELLRLELKFIKSRVAVGETSVEGMDECDSDIDDSQVK